MFTMGLVVALLGAMGALTAWFKPFPQGTLRSSSKEAYLDRWREVSRWSIRVVFSGVILMMISPFLH